MKIIAYDEYIWDIFYPCTTENNWNNFCSDWKWLTQFLVWLKIIDSTPQRFKFLHKPTAQNRHPPSWKYSCSNEPWSHLIKFPFLCLSTLRNSKTFNTKLGFDDVLSQKFHRLQSTTHWHYLVLRVPQEGWLRFQFVFE